MGKGRFSYVVRAVLASCVLFYAFRLSSPGRTLVDYTVLLLVTSAILWNLVQLARRFIREGRPGDVWHLLRTVLFWVVGIKSTVLRPAPLQSWEGALGLLMLVLAALDTVWIHRKEREMLARPSRPQEQSS